MPQNCRQEDSNLSVMAIYAIPVSGKECMNPKNQAFDKPIDRLTHFCAFVVM
jgi:hypothetical protein